MSFKSLTIENALQKRLLIPSLAVAAFSVGISNAVITLLAVDIANTFLGSANPTAVGTVVQINTFNAVGEIASAILLSILAVRFRYKPLFLVGGIIVVISALGSFLAPGLLLLQFFYALEGVGSIIVSMMAFTMIGDSLPADKKAKAISYVVSIGAVATLTVILLVGFVANAGGWRSVFLFIMLPASAVGLILASFVLPSKPRELSRLPDGNPYLKSFRQILTNKSATACLVSNILTVAGTQVAVFALAFYRTQFKVTPLLTMGVFETAALIYIIAPLVSGRLVNKFGAKPVTILSGLLAAFFTMAFFSIPNLWAAVTFDMLHVWFAATAGPAFVYLVLEQVPSSRGTMMSLNSVFNNVGNVIAPVVGGALLIFSSGIYGVVGLALGGLTVVGCAVLFFLVRDPAKIDVA